MFWKRLVELCTQKNTTPNAVAKQLHLSSGAASSWKKGAIPRAVTLQKLADFFEVSPESFFHAQTEQPQNPQKKVFVANQTISCTEQSCVIPSVTDTNKTNLPSVKKEEIEDILLRLKIDVEFYDLVKAIYDMNPNKISHLHEFLK